MGTELKDADCREVSMEANFTNEADMSTGTVSLRTSWGCG